MKKPVLASLSITLLLAACSSSKDANNSNFEKAINNHLAKVCLSIRPGGFMGANVFPASVEIEQVSNFRPQAQADADNERNQQPYAVLVRAGLLTTADGTVKQSAWEAPFGKPKDVPAKIYSLTDAGKKALADPNGKGTALCAAHYKVDEVVRFTQPSSAGGTTISQVSYTFSPTDVADWAKSPDVTKAYPQLSSGLAEHQQGQTTLVLASDGWIEASDFSR